MKKSLLFLLLKNIVLLFVLSIILSLITYISLFKNNQMLFVTVFYDSTLFSLLSFTILLLQSSSIRNTKIVSYLIVSTPLYFYFLLNFDYYFDPDTKHHLVFLICFLVTQFFIWVRINMKIKPYTEDISL